jgi:DNA-binding CsgD family transcriptional regulator
MTRGRPPYPDVLTAREWEVYYLLRLGLTNQEIADWLGVSFSAAKYHTSEILTKLALPSRRDVARCGLVPRVVAARRHSLPPAPVPATLARPSLRLPLVLATVALLALVAVSLAITGGRYPLVLPGLLAVGLTALALTVGAVHVAEPLVLRATTRHSR